MKTVKAKVLNPGDRVGIIAPASAPNDPARIDLGIQAIRDLGFEPVLAPNARKKLGFLGGTDEERVADLHTMFADPSIKALFCLRGGHGTTRLLPLLDPKIFSDHPKIFVGYSDTTALSAFFFQKSGLVTFYGPMVAVEFYKGATPFVRGSFLRTLATAEPYGPLGKPEGWTLTETLVPGKASGTLIGGCLTLFECLLGTPWQVSLRDSIFYFEDIDSEPYQTDRTLTHMLNAGVFEGVRGVAVGDCVGCEHVEGRSGYDNCQDLRTVIRERLGPLGVPILFGVPFGHGTEKATIPYGVQALLDADARELSVTEPALLPA